MSKYKYQRGAGHLVLFIAIFVTILGVLGFFGYNAWQKHNASANTADGGGGSRSKSLTCKLLSISPKPAVGVNSKYKVRLIAKNTNARVSLDLSPGRIAGDHSVWGKEKKKYVAINNETKTVTYNFTPRSTFKSAWPSKFGPVGKKLKTNAVNRGLNWSGTVTKFSGNCTGQNYL